MKEEWLAFYRCRWCDAIFERRRVAEPNGANAFHECSRDEEIVRHGVGEMIGFRRLRKDEGVPEREG